MSAVSTWVKVNSGLIKMYRVEVNIIVNNFNNKFNLIINLNIIFKYLKNFIF